MSTPTPVPAPPMRTGLSLTLIILGALLFICGPVIGMMFAATAGFSSALGDLQHQTRFTEETTVDADEGGTFFIYTSRTALPDGDLCAVVLADGQQVRVVDAPRDQNTNVGWERFESFARFALPADSSATVTCRDHLDTLVVGPAFDVTAFLDNVFGWPLVGGGLIMAAGFASAVVGIVRYPWQATASRRAAASQ